MKQCIKALRPKRSRRTKSAIPAHMKRSPDMLAYPNVGKNEVRKRDDHMRRTKIVCTIAPATESEEWLEQFMRAGMNVARLNFSHGCIASPKILPGLFNWRSGHPGCSLC